MCVAKKNHQNTNPGFDNNQSLIMIKLIVIGCLVYSIQAHFINYYPPTELAISDDEIVNRAVTELHNIDAATDLNECMTCKTRLQVAKFIALTRPDLVPRIFSTWCIESGNDEIQCHMNYGYPSEDYCTMGNDFTKMVSLMNPSGLDGDYFCYYHDRNCAILPETPLVDMSRLWPQNQNIIYLLMIVVKVSMYCTLVISTFNQIIRCLLKLIVPKVYVVHLIAET